MVVLNIATADPRPQVASRAQSIRAMQDSVVVLDIVAARAQHAKWMSSTRPTLVSTHSRGHTGSSSSSNNNSSNGSRNTSYGNASGSRDNSDSGSQNNSSSSSSSGDSDSLIWVPGALHPLLLASALPPPPNPPSVSVRTCVLCYRWLGCSDSNILQNSIRNRFDPAFPGTSASCPVTRHLYV